MAKRLGLGCCKFTEDLVKDSLLLPDNVGKLTNAAVNANGDLVLFFRSDAFPNDRQPKIFTIEYSSCEAIDGSQITTSKLIIAGETIE